MTLRVDNINNNIQINTKNPNNKVSNATKVASLLGSTVGVTASICAITRKNPMNLVKTVAKPKTVLKELQKLEFSGKDVIEIATGSITGGLLAGSAIDKDNTKAKAKEGLTQLVGNYIVPSAFVTGGIKLNKVLNSKFKYPPKTGLVKFAFGMVSLIAGVFAGNAISKKINKEVFKEDTYRPLKTSDWGMQADNVCLVTSMANEGTNLAKNVSKIIPIAHIIPGYIVGTKKFDYQT